MAVENNLAYKFKEVNKNASEYMFEAGYGD